MFSMQSPADLDGIEMYQNHAPNLETAPYRAVQRQNTAKSRFDVKDDPWAPIVLSLDGGGIRGLSELLIMHKIMQRIHFLIDRDKSELGSLELPSLNDSISEGSQGSSDYPPDSQRPLLPCYFFDYMIGTSTGGLIAVMLGRLRMNTADCIKAYWCLGNYIFRRRRYIRLYSAAKLRKAVIHVVEDNCGCHPPGTRCRGENELLRQWDYAEEGDVSHRKDLTLKNTTCKVALVAQRRDKECQVTHLFRSYNHSERFENDRREYNPQTLGRKPVKIWEACRATSAAPYYFRNMKIDAEEFLDGAAGNNNPSNVAWNEAKWMSNLLSPHDGQVAALVSLGCGEKARRGLFGKQKTLFYILKTWKYGKSKITDTAGCHDETETLADASGSAYFRFSVQPVQGDHGNKGLREVKLCECKTQARSSLWKSAKSIISTTKSHSWPSSHSPQDDEETEWHNNLQREAAAHDREKRKRGFNPEKYSYSTYDTIHHHTYKYCKSTEGEENVVRKIDECARLLLSYARARQAADPNRWRRFVAHPHPAHILHHRGQEVTIQNEA